MISETHLIHLLKTQFPSHIGDDAAVIPFTDTSSYVITQDILVEDIHFRLASQDIKSLAHKALHVNLSDIAAMGATPRYVLMGLSIPSDATEVSAFLKAFSKACKEVNVTLIGGDTTRSPNPWFISITVIGIAPTEHLKYRSTARPGDSLCLIGKLGYAHLGFTALEQEVTGLKLFKQAFHSPKACLDAGLWLGKQKAVHAMMDTSDGLYIDLKRLCEASQVSATIELTALPLSSTFLKACKHLNLDPIHTALTGGEDYGLLFTVEANHSFIEAYTPHVIGKISHGSGVKFTQNHTPKALKLTPFSHFE